MASYLAPNTQPPIFDPSQFIDVTTASSTTTDISDIQDTIDATQTIIDNDTAEINTIGTIIYTNFNRNNQVSGTTYSFTIGPVVPGGFYVGSVMLQAIATTTGFGFLQTGFLSVRTISGLYPAARPNINPNNGGVRGAYQQLFFAIVADTSGVITFDYQFNNKSLSSATTCPISINQTIGANNGRIVRIR